MVELRQSFSYFEVIFTFPPKKNKHIYKKRMKINKSNDRKQLQEELFVKKLIKIHFKTHVVLGNLV